jgi:hypothetical protein
VRIGERLGSRKNGQQSHGTSFCHKSHKGLVFRTSLQDA